MLCTPVLALAALGYPGHMITKRDARNALYDNLGSPGPQGDRVVLHEKAIASLIDIGSTRAEARAALLNALSAASGYVESVDTTSFGVGREDDEVWWVPDP